MPFIYHGCFKKNADGTNRIIANYEKFLLSTSRPFWKYIEDIPIGVNTRSQHKQQKLVNVELSIVISEEKKRNSDVPGQLFSPNSFIS